ncbi:cytochrome c oxidase subunit 2 [Tephrocybe sp. NHM501043]|nr:cytochrome c oxidase subunit 2 [Tephrocybe sp. NHM501043]
MTLFPETAKKAQAEIDSVVGNDRLPTFEDRPYLPYVDALAKEILRWHSVAPIGAVYRTVLLKMTYTMAISFLRALW